MNELHLFAGAGGGILGGMLLGHTCVCAVEIEPYCRQVLLQRQRDGILPKFPIWDDVRTFNGKPWRGLVDVVCGGFPCQDISVANKLAEGINGSRSGLWDDMRRIIGEVRPRFAFVENSPALVVRGLGRVLGDLADLGMDARWGIVGDWHTGAPHLRNRIWIFAYSKLLNGSIALSERGGSGTRRQDASGRKQNYAPNSGLRRSIRPDSYPYAQHEERRDHSAAEERQESAEGSTRLLGNGEFWRAVEQPQPLMERMGDVMAHRVDRLAAIGNGQVPAVVQLAWEILANDPDHVPGGEEGEPTRALSSPELEEGGAVHARVQG